MSSYSSNPLIISVEGNIGAGKTTILEKLTEFIAEHGHTDIVLLREPVDIWESMVDPESGENILQKFYADQKKWAFSFQVMAYASRLASLRNIIAKNPSCKMVICERSLDADKHIFAKMLHDDRLINPMDYQIYNHFCAEYAKDFKLSGIVYVDSKPEVCQERISKRARVGESSISLEYLTCCRNYHETWFENANMETPLLRIDTSGEAKYDPSDPEDKGIQWLNQICAFIDSL